MGSRSLHQECQTGPLVIWLTFAAALSLPLSGFMNRKLVLGVLLVIARPLVAQTDSVAKTLLTRTDAKIAAGAVAASVAISFFDPRIAAFFSDTSLAHVRTGQRLDGMFTRINETTLTLAGVAAYGVGRLSGSNDLTDIAFHTTEAIVSASLASQLIRGPLGRSRPHVTNDKDQYDFHWFKGFSEFNQRAFPSIHSGSGFAAATALVRETKIRRPGAVKFVAPVLYGLALTPGLSRMYLGQHWASDIFAGAVMGTFAGYKAVDYSHSHPGNRFQDVFVPSNGLNLSLERGSVGLSWGKTF
jgi:membrane-associated phospholipid phosphatase